MIALLAHYLKISFRSIWKDKTYSLINLVGLTVAMASCFLFVFWIRYEQSFEKEHPNADRIYQVIDTEIHQGWTRKKVTIAPPVARELKAQYPFVEESIFIMMENISYSTDQESRIRLTTAWSHPDFFQVFPLRCVAGSLSIQSRQNAAFVTEEVAKRYFGSPANAIGKRFENPFQEANDRSHVIEGVVSLPINSHIQFDILRIMSEGDRMLEYNGGLHYILVKKGYKFTSNNVYLDEKKQAEIGGALSNDSKTKYMYMFQSLEDVHLYTDPVTEKMLLQETVYYGDYKQVRLFAWITVLILLLAIINYVNTSTARAMNRSKEVGIRKVSGAQKMQLVVRFLIESFLLSFVAVVLAIDLAKWVFPAFENIMGNAFLFRVNGELIVVAACLCVLTTLLSGGYAAFYLSSFDPVTVLKGGTRTGSKEGVRKWLTGLQFALSIGVLVCTVIIYRQLDYILHKDLGFDRENVYELSTGLWYESENYQQALCKNPYILNATMAAYPPFDVQLGYSGISWEGCNEAVKETEVAMLSCDYRFASTFGLQVVAGEFIQPGYTWWQWSEEKSYSIVINESFARLLEMDNPLGTIVRYSPFGSNYTQEGKVIGVVKDFFFQPLQEAMIPLIINFNPEATTKMYVKIRPEKKAETLAFIEEQYYQHRVEEAGNNIPYRIKPLDAVYENLYHKEIRLEKLLVFFSVLSIVLSCMGIFGMISFMLERRTREIALRKINGARVQDILLLFFKELGYLIVFASLVALPVSWVLIYRWMEQYAYRTTMGWWVFVLVPVSVWLLTVATVIVQVYYAARRNPVEALRSE